MNILSIRFKKKSIRSIEYRHFKLGQARSLHATTEVVELANMGLVGRTTINKLFEAVAA